MVNLKNWPGSEDIYPVVAFLRHNEGRVAQGHASFFKMKVFEPPCLSVNVPNRAYSSVIESCFNAAQLRVRSSFFSMIIFLFRMDLSCLPFFFRQSFANARRISTL